MDGTKLFRHKMTLCGACPGNPHELLGIETIRVLIKEVWGPFVDVDGLILEMSRRGILSLHEHDWPQRIKLEGRESEYLWWGSTRCFVGAHLRVD